MWGPEAAGGPNPGVRGLPVCSPLISQGHKVPWYQYCPLAQALPELDPDQLVEVLYSFAQRDPPSSAAYASSTSRDKIYLAYAVLRDALCKIQALDPIVQLGGKDQDGNRRLGMDFPEAGGTTGRRRGGRLDWFWAQGPAQPPCRFQNP